ncbi:hypothetical protein [Labilibaculum euxinus]
MSSKFLAKVSLVLMLFYLFPNTAYSNVSLSAIFGKHMVMQQNSEVKLWGWGKPMEKIRVTTSWDNDTLNTVTTNNAKWSVMLKTPEAGGPYSIKIEGYNSVVIDDILMGEVWLLSGQSNMEWKTSFGIFDCSEGLHCEKADLPYFELAGEDGIWFSAQAFIKDDKVLVRSEEVRNPVNVRFAWANSATPKLFNKDNLPASCFTAIDF